MNLISYNRVSTNDQAESGLGLAAQAAAIDAFAKRHGHTITATFTDAGISGAAGLEDRPGLAAAIAGLRKGDALVIAKRCRLGRDAFAIAMIERAVAKRGAVILSADGVGNESDANGQFMKAIIDAAAAYERNVIRSRTKAALAAKRAAGRLTGEVPFGWNVDADGNLIEVAEEQAIIAKINELRQAGVSLRKIAGILTDAGIVTKKGKATWYAETVKSILERQAALAA